jgi:hypothetical protein
MMVIRQVFWSQLQSCIHVWLKSERLLPAALSNMVLALHLHAMLQRKQKNVPNRHTMFLLIDILAVLASLGQTHEPRPHHGAPSEDTIRHGTSMGNVPGYPRVLSLTTGVPRGYSRQGGLPRGTLTEVPVQTLPGSTPGACLDKT